MYVSVNVRATLPVDFTNITGAVTSANAGTGNSASANLSVSSPPVVSQGFGFGSVPAERDNFINFHGQQSEREPVSHRDRIQRYSAGWAAGSLA